MAQAITDSTVVGWVLKETMRPHVTADQHINSDSEVSFGDKRATLGVGLTRTCEEVRVLSESGRSRDRRYLAVELARSE